MGDSAMAAGVVEWLGGLSLRVERCAVRIGGGIPAVGVTFWLEVSRGRVAVDSNRSALKKFCEVEERGDAAVGSGADHIYLRSH